MSTSNNAVIKDRPRVLPSFFSSASSHSIVTKSPNKPTVKPKPSKPSTSRVNQVKPPDRTRELDQHSKHNRKSSIGNESELSGRDSSRPEVRNEDECENTQLDTCNNVRDETDPGKFNNTTGYHVSNGDITPDLSPIRKDSASDAAITYSIPAKNSGSVLENVSPSFIDSGSVPANVSPAGKDSEPVPANVSLPTNTGTSTSGDKVKRPLCRYGTTCYRRNAEHKKEFSHFGDPDYEDQVAGLSSSSTVTRKPDCQYGSRCYRKNKEHREKFNHESVSPLGRSKRNRKTLVDLDVDSDESETLDDFSNSSDEYEMSFIDDNDSDDDDDDSSISEDDFSGDSCPSDEEDKKRKKNKLNRRKKKKRLEL